MPSTPHTFARTLAAVRRRHDALLRRRNRPDAAWYNGIFTRYEHPVVTADHVPLEWRFDLNPRTNPGLLERLAVNTTFNSGAICWQGRFLLVVRIEGSDRKSFFAIAESPNGIDQFRFWPEPCVIPETANPDTNLYDMRLTAHEDGWVYGIFCTERRNPKAPPGDTSSAVAQCGIARTRDLKTWERLPDLKTHAPQQRNVVLHPEFVGGRYALYTRPQETFSGLGGGIGWSQCDSLEHAGVTEERVVDPRHYHTISEFKNGQGPAPIKTRAGWLHLAHGVRSCASGRRYVLYLFLTDLADPSRVIAKPGGYFIAPMGEERIGDVSNVVFANGWVALPDGRVYIYYASSDTRQHVATSTIEQLLDYVHHTPPDAGRTAACVEQRLDLIRRNAALTAGRGTPAKRPARRR